MKWTWLQNKAKAWRRYPIALFGFVAGHVRWETFGGGSMYRPSHIGTWFVFTRPMVVNGTPYAVTHLQKSSRLGFLVMWPLCFHVWFTFRYQQEKLSDGNVYVDVPGSERVLYFRVGVARWDSYVGEYECPAWYGPGLHWD